MKLQIYFDKLVNTQGRWDVVSNWLSIQDILG